MDPATGRTGARRPDLMPRRSQNLEPAFYDPGAFCWALAATWADPAARVWPGGGGGGAATGTLHRRRHAR